jgi:hypothetical protein
VAVVEALDGERSVGEAFDLVGVADSRRAAFLTALGTLGASEMVRAA